MMPPLPLTQADTLFDRIVDLKNQSLHPDAFTLRALRRDAAELLKVDAYQAYMALGALATLAWDADELDAQHRRAIGLQDDELSRGNYAISLQLNHRYEEAAEQAILASTREPENLSTLEMAINFALLAGHLSQAISLTHTMRQRNPDFSPTPEPKEILGYLERTGVPEAELALGMRIMNETLRRHRLYAENTRFDIDVDPDEPSVLVEFQVNTDFTRAQAMDSEACARLCEELPEGGHPGALMFSIVGMFDREQHPV